MSPVPPDCSCCAGPVGPEGPAGPAGPAGAQGIQGEPGAGVPPEYSEFFALMPGDNSATVAAGANVEFPQDALSTGIILRSSASQFILPTIGFYKVFYQVSVTEAGQLVVTLDDGAGPVEIARTVTGRATGTSQISGTNIIETTVINAVLSIRNPTGNTPALTITPSAGGTNSVSANLIIERLA